MVNNLLTKYFNILSRVNILTTLIMGVQESLTS